jgi:anti-sigma factor RsiW
MSARNGHEMTCKEMVELVTDYLEERLAPDERTRFERHLEICPGCQAYLEQMRATLRALGRLPEESISEAARTELISAFRDWHAGR